MSAHCNDCGADLTFDLECPFCAMEAERDALAARVETLESVTEFMWTVVCNVSEGAWAKQNAEWQEAAARVRDQWHAYLASRPAGEETQG